MNTTLCKTFAFALFLYSGPMTVWAGIATFQGYGQVRTTPEFVDIEVTVTSECYASAQEASVANDEISSKVLDLLNQTANPTLGDEVVATGGFVERLSLRHPTTNEPICVRTFRKQNRLDLKLHSIENLPKIFSDLQDKLYSLGTAVVPETTAQPISYVEITAPQGGMGFETYQRLERKALLSAIEDAREKLKLSLALIHGSSFRIKNLTENQLITQPIPDASRIGRDFAVAPIQLGKMTIRKWVNVEFEFSEDEPLQPVSPNPLR